MTRMQQQSLHLDRRQEECNSFDIPQRQNTELAWMLLATVLAAGGPAG